MIKPTVVAKKFFRDKNIEHLVGLYSAIIVFVAADGVQLYSLI
jgi:hypothetical protein